MAKSGDNTTSDPPGSEAVLPAQFWTHLNHGAQPERRLMAAVLEDAVALRARAGRSRDPEVIKDAEAAGAWMESDDRTGPFAFATICDILGLDPEGVREAIEAIRSGNGGFVRPRDSAGRGRHQIRGKRPRSKRAA